MYYTELTKKEAKYAVVKKKIMIRYINKNSPRKRYGIWINLYQGIYTYTIQDAITFVKKELIQFYIEENLKELHVRERRKKLTDEIGGYLFKDLVSGEYITPHKGLFDYDFFEEIESNNSPLSMELFFLVMELSNWDGRRNEQNNFTYQFPVLKINIKVTKHEKRQYRPTFHTKSNETKTLTPSKAVMIASTDPEYSSYLTMRQKNGGCGETNMHYKPNWANVDGSWKKHCKCRKQWAKYIDNPSYEKLSAAAWKHQLELE